MNPFSIKTPKAENEQHLNNIRNKPCIICGDWTTTEAAHVRMASAKYGKPPAGMGIKPRGPNGEECYVNPLCGRHHRAQHDHPLGEEYFWKLYPWIDPIATAGFLWINRNHPDAMEEICKNNQRLERDTGG